MKKIVIIVAAVVVIGVIIGGVALALNGGDDEDATAGLTRTASVNILVQADGVVLPVRAAELSMDFGGVVDAVFVTEGQNVQKGDVLATLERKSEEASLKRAKADLKGMQARLDKLIAVQSLAAIDDRMVRAIQLGEARIALRTAEEMLKHVSGANLEPGAIVMPEGAQLEADRAMELANGKDRAMHRFEAILREKGLISADGYAATTNTIENVAERNKVVADARLAVVEAQEGLNDVEDVEELLNDAVDAVNAATRDLDTAIRDVAAAEVDSREAIRQRGELFDEAEAGLTSIYKKWLGIELTDEELTKTPDELLAEWDLEYEAVFDRDGLTYVNRVAQNDLGTRWNEFTIYAWLFLHPTTANIKFTCADNVVFSAGSVCVQREIEDAWSAYQNAKDGSEAANVAGPTAIADAENAIIAAEQALQDRQGELEERRSDRPTLDILVAKSNLELAIATLEDVENFPNEGHVAEAEARYSEAQADYDRLLEFPDPLEVALAEEKLAAARLMVSNLEGERDPLVVAGEQAEFAEAEAQVSGALARVELARVAFRGKEVVAPFSGTVVSVGVDILDEVTKDTVIARVADMSEWIIETEDLDELGVVNLQEGDTVTVTFDALAGVELSGTVISIGGFGENQGGGITYDTKIRLIGSDSRLRWNMTSSIVKTSVGRELGVLR
ncbi:MAG: biotin/lipoyl-binding protein [Chloroflexi bacterium]|nr:biotin/lipoyl-binding protein [Chloroflexota bacterium]